MVVIITHKNTNLLKRCIESYNQVTSIQHKLVVVETSNDKNSQEFTESNGYIFENTPGENYESGAINYIFQKYPSENEYYFFHDSLTFQNPGWEEMFTQVSKGKHFVALCHFDLNVYHIDTTTAISWYESVYQEPYPMNTIPLLGSMFYIPGEWVSKLVGEKCLEFMPKNKLETCAMERIWTAIAARVGEVKFTKELTNDQFGWEKWIKKEWVNRQ